MDRSIDFPDPPLSHNGILVRGLVETDAPAFSDIARHPSIAHDAFHDGINMENVESVRAYITRGLERMKKGTQVLLAVTDKDARLIGQTMLFNFDYDNLSAELGFWVSPAARGRGVAATTIRLTCRWGFDELRLERIFGMTTPQNRGARRAMERAGLRPEGILRGYEKTADGRWDMATYGLLSTDDF